MDEGQHGSEVEGGSMETAVWGASGSGHQVGGTGDLSVGDMSPRDTVISPSNFSYSAKYV